MVPALVHRTVRRRVSRLGHLSSRGTPSGPAWTSRPSNVHVLAGERAEVLGDLEVVLGQEVHGQVRRTQRHSVGVVGLGQPDAVALRVDGRLGVETHQAACLLTGHGRRDHHHRWVQRRHQRVEGILSHGRSVVAQEHRAVGAQHVLQGEVGQLRPEGRLRPGAGRRPSSGRWSGTARPGDRRSPARRAVGPPSHRTRRNPLRQLGHQLPGSTDSSPATRTSATSRARASWSAGAAAQVTTSVLLSGAAG